MGDRDRGSEAEEETLDLTENEQLDPPEGDDDDQDSEGGAYDDELEAGDGEGDGDEAGDGDEETIISFGDAPDVDQEGDSTVIRQLRKELREAKAKARELEKPVVERRELRDEPTMEEHAFDEDAFKADWKAWNQEKAEIDREQATANERQAAIQRDWEADVARFETQKQELAADGVDSVDEAQDAVASTLNLAQQAALVKAAENPARLMVALGRSPTKLAELAKITDVIKFAAAVAKVEGTVKVVKSKRRAPNIDSPQRGSGRLTTSDKKLEQLEERAARTGDRTELIRYKTQLAERAKSKK